MIAMTYNGMMEATNNDTIIVPSPDCALAVRIGDHLRFLT